MDDKNTFSFYTTQNWSDNTVNGTAKITDVSGTIVSNAPNVQNLDSKNQTYNVNYTHEFEKGHNIEFESTFSINKTPQYLLNQDFIQPDNGNLNYFNDISNERNNVLFNIDYTKPISKKGKLELGLEYREDNTENTNITNQEFSNNSSFTYNRKIYSGYVNYGHQFEKIAMQIGARIEQFNVEGNFNEVSKPSEDVEDEIFTIYPSAFFTYTPSEKNQFQLSYSKRVDRPNIQQVNPIREWSTPLITSVGNEFLDPQFTNSIELNYTRKVKGGSITFGGFYRNIKDVISRVTYQDPTNPDGQILTFQNFDDTNAYGLELSASYRIAKWWRANASTDFYAQKQFGVTDLNNPDAERLEVQNEVFNARISNSFTVSEKLKLQLFAMYRGENQDIQWKIDPMAMVNIGADYSVLKGKGNITFRVNDIFKTMKFKFDSSNPFVQNGQFNWESRTTYLGFSYRFGGGKNRAKQEDKGILMKNKAVADLFKTK
nr:outer membrane beta-barrel family protein [Tenacibaculum sp. SG-28]